jgi:hypothetical protein
MPICAAAVTAAISMTAAPTASRRSTAPTSMAKRVGVEGRLLRDGDIVVLAASDPQHPSPDAPGVAGFVFRASCAAGAG